jgi:GWxTD domain-containing protein
MTTVPRPAVAALLFVCFTTAIAAPAESNRHRDADALARHAVAMLDRGTFDARRVAIGELEQATLLAPEVASHQLALGQAYYGAGFFKSARARFERAELLDPASAEAAFGLGQVARRDWLKYLTPASLDLAIERFDAAAVRRPGFVDARLLQVPLLIERGDLPAAAAAARQAHADDPARAEATLAVAYTDYRMGRIERADSAFRAALPRLQHGVRERFEDIGPVATERDTMILHSLPAEIQPDFLRRFWKSNDPDLTTALNEAQLEYWARVAHAYFLFYDPRRREWDERGEVYVRYGPPRSRQYNPIWASLRDFFGMPSNLLIWEYPELGMRVALEDRLLTEKYLLPISREVDMDPIADPEQVARHDQSVAVSGGRGVFPKLPPGVLTLPMVGVLARFEGEPGRRILAQVECPGAPGERRDAEWVVLDSTLREVARGSRSLSPSACDPTEWQVGDFATDLPAGRYLVGVSVSDGAGRRGVFRAETEIERAKPERLALSDVVVTCGMPRVEQPLRLEPNPAALVAGSALTAYFEIYHLGAGQGGESRFEMTYTVRSMEKDERIWFQRVLEPRQAPPPISATREETQIGPRRRQFVNVPVDALPPGRYRLEIRVRDLNRDEEAVGRTEFVKSGFAVGG